MGVGGIFICTPCYISLKSTAVYTYYMLSVTQTHNDLHRPILCLKQTLAVFTSPNLHHIQRKQQQLQ